LSEEEQKAWEAGRFGSGPPPSGGSALDAWQQGQAIRNLNEAELARQQQAAGSGQTSALFPETPAAPTAPSGGWSSSNAGTAVGGGSAAGGGIAATAGCGCLLIPVLLLLGVYCWVPLYPLSGAASIATAAGVYLVLQGRIPRTPLDVNSNALLIGVGAGLVVLWLTSRLEQRLGRHAAYRIPRHLVRLALFGLAANIWLLNQFGLGFARPGFAHLVRPFETPTQTAVFVGVVVGMHFVLWTDNVIRQTWHGMLEAVRLR
jgi:hypothetical protein